MSAATGDRPDTGHPAREEVGAAKLLSASRRRQCTERVRQELGILIRRDRKRPQSEPRIQLPRSLGGRTPVTEAMLPAVSMSMLMGITLQSVEALGAG